MKIAILGGTGLISTGITRELLDAGHSVTHFNRGVTTSPFADRVSTVPGTRGSLADLERVAGGGFDAVVDMICYTPDEAEAAVQAFSGKTRQYIMCSTVDVYTKPAAFFPVTEEHPRVPSETFPYAFEKQRAEEVLWRAWDAGAFALTVLRPAATYVSGAVAPLGTFGLYVDRIRQNREVILHGDGSSIWVACHRDDVARAFASAVGNERAIGHAYNVTGEELLTWNAYWSEVARAMGAGAPRFVHIPTDLLIRAAPTMAEWCWMNFQYNNIFDNSAAHRDLGFRYTTTWAEAVRSFDYSSVPEYPAETADAYQALVDQWHRAEESLLTGLSGTRGL